MAEKKTTDTKEEKKMPDLGPRKDPRGGLAISSNQPLPIPPPGFVTPSQPANR